MLETFRATPTDPLGNFVSGLVQIVSDSTVFYPQYRNKPREFAKDILGITWTESIAEIAEAILDCPKVVVPAGHAVGKTHGVAGIAIWWLSTRKTKVVTTAPTWRQVKDLIWREIRVQHRRALKVVPGIPNTTNWDLDAEDWFATGISTNDPTRFQGYHSDELLVILDEACGIEKFIWESIEDGLAVSEGNRILAIGNPTDPTSRFAQVCRDSTWKKFTLSCIDHPNVVQGKQVFRGAVTRRWVEERIKKWCIPYEALEGDENPADVFEYLGKHYIPNDLFRVRLLGLFPIEGGSQVIPLAYIWKAFNRESKEPEGAGHFGLDVARFGDDMSVLTMGTENWVILSVDVWQGKSTTQSAGRVKYWTADFSRQGRRVETVAVDDIGVGGGVTDILADGNYPVIGVNVSAEPYDKDLYRNLRSELYFLLAEQFRSGAVDLTRVASFEEVITEELASLTYDYTPKGQRFIEPKDKIKEKIGRSPDFADSLMLYGAFLEAGHITGIPIEKLKEERWDAAGESWEEIMRNHELVATF